MEEIPTEQQPATDEKVAAPGKLARIKVTFGKGVAAIGRLLQKSALYFFMGFLPLALTGYPAYLIVRDLLQSNDAATVEATLTDIDINKVQDGESGFTLFKSKGHTDVTLSFKGVEGKKYRVIIEMPWTSPGLRKQMDAKYGERDSFTLYLGKDGIVQIDEQVAGTRMTLLSMLMALVLLTTMLSIFLRHRLSERMPSLVTHESAANARSIIYAQLATLILAFTFTVILHYTPLVVSTRIFLGIYWGAAVLIGVSLRLLVFQNPPPPPAPVEEEKPRDRGLLR